MKNESQPSMDELQNRILFLKKENDLLKINLELQIAEKNNEKSLISKISKISEELIQYSDTKPDYTKITEGILEISGARYASFNLFDDNNCDFTTVAVSGINENIKLACTYFGFSFDNKKWPEDEFRAEKTKNKIITEFETLHDLSNSVLSKSIVLLLEKTFNLGKIYIVKIEKDNKTLGDFTLVFYGKDELVFKELVELYAHQVGMFLDRNKTTENLQKSEEKFHSLYMNMSEGAALHTFLYSSDGKPIDYKIIETNPAFEIQLGLSRDLVIGKTSIEAYHVAEPPFLHVYCAVVETGIPQTFETYFPPLDKYFSISVFKPSEGSFATIFKDITDRIQKERELNDSKEYLSILFKNSPDAFLIMKDGIFVECNFASEILLGGKRDQIIGLTPGMISPEFQQDGRKSNETSIEMIAIAAKNKKHTFEWTHIKFDKTPIEVEVSLASMLVNNEENFFITIRDITERKYIELALKESEQKYRELVKEMQVGLLIQGPNSEIILNNSKALYLLGLSEEELLGKTSFDPDWNVINEDGSTFPGPSHPVPLAIKTKKPVRNVIMGVYNPIRKQRVWLLVNAEPQLNDENEIKQVVCSFIDITMRKNAEKKLSESEQRYRKLIQTANEGILVIQENLLKFVNPKFIEITAKTEKELLAQPLANIIFEEDLKQMKVSLQALLQGETPIPRFPIRITQNNNAIKWVEVSGTSIDWEGKPAVLSFVMDITDRKVAEDALRQSEEKFRHMTENSSDVIWHINKTYEIDYISPADERLRGFKHEEVIGKNVNVLLNTEGKEKVKNIQNLILFEESQPNAKAFSGKYELEEICKDGSWIWTEVNLMADYNCEGKFTGIHGVTRDISDRKKAELEIQKINHELLKLNHEKDKFFSIIAHDLRAPFNGFLGLTELMAEGLEKMTLEEIQKIAISMKKSANALFRLLENLLQWSQVQRGLFPFKPIRTNLKSVLSESTSILIELAIKKDINIAYSVNEKTEIIADIDMLQSIIRNLLSNALKFTQAGGKVSIDAKESDSDIILVFTDTGIGMSKTIIEGLFQLDANLYRRGIENEPSSGLGLLLCKEFVEKHNGKIWVNSKVNEGSSFYVSLPK